MPATFRAAALFGPLLLGAGARASAPTEVITVFAAASLTEAFTDLGQRFEQENGGVHVRFNYAGSQQLVLQLQQGAEADVLASADEQWMKTAQDGGLLAAAPAVFARNRLVVIVPAANPGRINALADLARPGLKLVVAAVAVPAGRYTRETLERLSGAKGFSPDYMARVLANVVSQEDNVKAVAAKVGLGEADAGIVYRSDVTPALTRSTKVLDIPDAYNAVAAYPIALLRASRHAELARRFVALVMSDSGQAALVRHGLLPAAGPGAAAARP